ncbi:hypothetical protein B5F39_08125 [Cloacibacillus sp. An23]|nr:hypothetical protein B5F39_08125 [Cloacibacillus sp. An23]
MRKSERGAASAADFSKAAGRSAQGTALRAGIFRARKPDVSHAPSARKAAGENPNFSAPR